MVVRAVRGAVQVAADEPELIAQAVTELVQEVLARNELDTQDLISIIFTTTPDLRASFPAYAARAVVGVDVPLLGACEVDVPGALPRVVRLLAHVESSRPRTQVKHVYLGGAAVLRPDLSR